MIIIRNNLLCNRRQHLELENYIRKQTLGKVIVVPSYCEVLAVGKGDPEIVLVDQEGNRIQVQRRGRWLNSSSVAFEEACSVCGGGVPWDDFGNTHRYSYCPNCGAKMDLE